MTKYISTKDAVRLTGLTTQDIYNLILKPFGFYLYTKKNCPQLLLDR